MSYLLCRQCNGYYELKQTESPQDFETCSCGGPLRYIKSISRFYKKNSDYFDDDYDIDTTVVIYNSLQQFKNNQEISSNYTHSDEDYYQEPLEDEAYFNQQNSLNYGSSEYRKEILSSEGFESFKAVAFENYYDANMDAESHVSPVELQIEVFETSNQQNPHLEAPQENYEFVNDASQNNEINQEYYEDVAFNEASQNSVIRQEYYEDVAFLSQSTFSIKKYFTNNILTILGLGILPLEYMLLFGNLTLNVIGSFLIALSVIIAYLPRAHKIERHEDINRVFNVWVVYAIIFTILLLSWVMMNLVTLPVIYI